MKVGLKPLDTTFGNLGLGELFCVAGRSCVGKTALLLEVAQRIHRRYETNVVFATARELPEQLIAKAPVAARSRFKELPALDVLRDEVQLPLGRESCIYVLDVQGVSWARAHYIAHRLNAEHPSRCDLLISDGWTVTPDRVTYTKRVVGDVAYRLDFERPAQELSAATLAGAKRYAEGSGVATIYGIGTAGNDIEGGVPRFEDLKRLRSAVSRNASRTVLLHRPELYLSHGGGREAAAGMIELTAAGDGRSGARRATLQYDAAKRLWCAPRRRR